MLRKLRKLAWAENEAYLVRVMLKAVKGRFSQVPQVASLASGLARYHPSLGVAFVDALLEEVNPCLPLEPDVSLMKDDPWDDMCPVLHPSLKGSAQQKHDVTLCSKSA